jgi:ribosomal protein L11 methyltransferase
MDSAITLTAGASAFGDGKHPSTAMILQALEALDAKQFHPRSICDMGSGSGILALRAAQKFPRATVLAVDIEASAVAAIRENAAANQVLRILPVHAESFRHPEIAAHAPYDLILMNILAEPLLALAHEAVAALNHEGILILSGILVWQQEQILDAYQHLGLDLTHRLQQGDWVALLWVKAGA